MTRPLPPQPNLQQLKQQAKELVRSLKSGDAEALARLHEEVSPTAEISLSQAQLLVAREYEFDGWTELKIFVQHAAINRGDGEMLPVIAAASAGDVTALQELVSADPSALESEGPVALFDHGVFRPLHVAARRGHVDAVRYLLDAGADVNAKGTHGRTALKMALDRGRKQIVDLLSEHGAETDIFDALHLDDTASVVRMLDAEPDLVQARDPDGATLLHLAPTREVATMLVERGADVEAQVRGGNGGSTPLQTAAGGGRREVVEYLATQGAFADIDIFSAVALDDVDGVRQMLDSDPRLVFARADHGHHGGRTLLHGVRSVELAELLLDHGADINALETGHNTTPLASATHRDRTGELPRYLISRGATIPHILIAILLEQWDHMRELLAEDPSLANWTSSYPDFWTGYFPLHMAVVAGNAEIVRELVEVGADINVRSTIMDATPLAMAGNQSEAKEVLLELGAKE